ncbi:hypothetical protein TNCV_1340631 [Trichonephila clavipes]|nr:hypothetical protein TNCV_1340631 [Trichonephila clavipes]
MKHLVEWKTQLSSLPHHRLSYMGLRDVCSPYAQRSTSVNHTDQTRLDEISLNHMGRRLNRKPKNVVGEKGTRKKEMQAMCFQSNYKSL